MNGGTAQMNGGSVSWTPETPFLSDPHGGGATVRPASETQSFALESPFLSEFSADGSPGARTPQAVAFAELLETLRDEEFDSALAGVAEEAAAVAEETFYEGEEPGQQRLRQQQTAAFYLDGVASRAEAALERLAAETEGKDLSGMNEDSLGEYLEGFTPADSGASPVAEEFIKKLFKKATKAVSGAVKLAKRGLKVVGSMLPHTWILKKLIGMVRPMLTRVLRLAIDKLPVSIQPLARQLAGKFLGTQAPDAGTAGTQPSEPAEPTEPAATDPSAVASEVDTMIAGYTVEGEDFDRRISMEALLEDRQSSGSRSALSDLDHARTVFAARLSQMDQGEDPTPAVEQFVPAILGALKLGVRIIGRPKIVRFLAGHVAGLIRPHLGPENANKLSNALVDAGLKLVQLEGESVDGGMQRVASETIASTIEDTVSRLVQTLPTEEWESNTLLEAYARESFEQAAAANFPDDTVRGELHEAGEVKGVWSRPRGRRYKKYSRIPSVVLTPQIAKAIPSFRGVPLHAILRDRFGIVGPIRVNVHLYEAVAGTTPGAITRGEGAANGGALGSATPPIGGAPPTVPGSAPTSGTPSGATSAGSDPATTSELHPLTEATAGLLLREPGLGRNVDEGFLESPNALAVGQRLYRLSVEGQRGVAARQGRRTRRLRARVDLARGEVRVLIYLSEATAQEIAQALRRKAPPGVVLNLLRRAFEPQVRAQGEGPAEIVQVTSESLADTSEALTRRVHRGMGRTMRRALLASAVRAIAAELDRRYAQLAGEFDAAANADADGVTIRLTLSGVPWLAAVRRLAARAATREDEATPRTAAATSTMTITPGYTS
jgi:hypothetical protein